MKLLHKSQNTRVRLDEKNAMIVVKFKGEFDHLDELKRDLTYLASHVNAHEAKYLLLDNEDLEHPINKEFQEWAHTHVELPILNAGVEKIAFVLAADDKTFALIHQNDTKRKRYFRRVSDAKNWLEE